VAILAIKKRLEDRRTGTVEYCVANSAFGGAPRRPGQVNPKREWFRDFLRAYNELGPGPHQADMVAFHPFTETTAKYIECTEFAYDSVQELLPAVQPRPKLCMTAWGKHGSGNFDTNANIEGAALIAAILITMQELPVEFTIYYKFNGIRANVALQPSLVLLNGELKPTALPFMMISDLAQVSKDRVSAECSNGDSILAVATPDSLCALVSCGERGRAAPSHLRVEGWAHEGKPCTLTIETAKSEDRTASAIGDVEVYTGVEAGLVAAVDTVTVQGRVRGDGQFYTGGAPMGQPFQLPLECPYVARLTLICN